MKRLLSLIMAIVMVSCVFTSVCVSAEVNVTRPAGKISATPVEIKVDGEDSDVLKVGKNNVIVYVTNSDSDDCVVSMVLSLNKSDNGINKTSGVKVVTKNVPAGETVDFSAEMTIDANTSFTSGRILIYAIDNLEPAIIADEHKAVEYVGTGADGENIYRINSFQ